MNLHLEPGPQLADLVYEIFALEAVAVFDAELHQVYPAGIGSRPRELAQNAYTFSTRTTMQQAELVAALSGSALRLWEAWWSAAIPAL